MSKLENTGKEEGGVTNKIPLQDLRLMPHQGGAWNTENVTGHRGTITGTEPVEWDYYDKSGHALGEHSDERTNKHLTHPRSNGKYYPNVSGDKEYSPKLPDAKEIENPVYIDNHDWDDDDYSPELPDTPLMAHSGTKDGQPPPLSMYDYTNPKDTLREQPEQSEQSRHEEVHEAVMPIAVAHIAKDTNKPEMSANDTENENHGQTAESAPESMKKVHTMVSQTGSYVSVNSIASGKQLLRKNQVSPVKNTPIRRSTSYDRDLIRRKKSIVFGMPDENTDGAGCCGWLLYMFSILLIIVTLPFSLVFCIKVVQEYERAVIFRLGRLPLGGAKGPGIFFIIPCIESYTKIDLRTVSFDVPPQEVLTKDSVTVSVDAVVYYRVSNPTVSVANVENAHHSTRLLAQTTLRNILGTKNMSEILSDRESISQGMQSTLDEATDRWGIKVERVEIKDVRLPVQLQRAMAAEAEAAREARAKVIAAEGEQKASHALKEAADVMSNSSAALQLRYLQTLSSISSEKNSTIVFPLPIDIMKSFMDRK